MVHLHTFLFTHEKKQFMFLLIKSTEPDVPSLYSTPKEIKQRHQNADDWESQKGGKKVP